MKRLLLFLSVSCAAVAGCSSDDSEPPPIPPGSRSGDGGGANGNDAQVLVPADGGGSDGGEASDGGRPPPPVPSGCITDVSPGDHTYTCEGFTLDATIPAACQAPGCGLILQLHGDTGTGPLMDANTNLRALGNARGYIVLAPTGYPIGTVNNTTYPGSTWSKADDLPLVTMTKAFETVFRVDPKKIHAAGFSRGGIVTWRLLCDHADYFASVAIGGAGSEGIEVKTLAPEVTCFKNGRLPSRPTDFFVMSGNQDMKVGASGVPAMLSTAVQAWSASPYQQFTSVDGKFETVRWRTNDGIIIQSVTHDYVTDPAGPWASDQGHCIPGSTAPVPNPYGLPCKPPNYFTWGAAVMRFFMDHPRSP